MKKLIIYGAGDIGKFLAYNPDLFGERYEIFGFVDDDPAKKGGTLCGLPVFGMEHLDAAAPQPPYAVIAVSSPAAKRAIAEKLRPYVAGFPNFIAKCSWISRATSLGEGVIIFPNCSVEHETTVGSFVTVNAGCTIGHNVELGQYANLSPGVHLAGFTRVGEGANLGIGCCTRQGVRIGARSVAGGQAMLIGDVADDSVAVGVPAVVKGANSL